MDDILDRLKQIATAKHGEDGVPPEEWADVIMACHDAMAEITRLRATVFGQNARLDQLQSIVGCAMAEPLVTFNDIKKAIPTMKGNGQ
jgi:hypothetical protein